MSQTQERNQDWRQKFGSNWQRVENWGQRIMDCQAECMELVSELTRRDQEEASHKDSCFKRLGWKPEGFMKVKEKNLWLIGWTYSRKM